MRGFQRELLWKDIKGDIAYNNNGLVTLMGSGGLRLSTSFLKCKVGKVAIKFIISPEHFMLLKIIGLKQFGHLLYDVKKKTDLIFIFLF